MKNSTIADHTKAITDLLNVEVMRTLEKLREAENEALERIRKIAPVEYDYEAAAAYLSIRRRTLERRVARRQITFRKDGQRVLFTQSALDQYKMTLTTERREPRTLTL